ncbi:MAG: hypothetical protein ACLT4C_02525 [Butyricicoccus sp.]
MASIGHPIIGDPVYGLKKTGFPISAVNVCMQRSDAHAPENRERMEFSASLPQYFTEVLDKLERMQ